MAEYIDIDSPVELVTVHGRQFTGTIRRILNTSALDYNTVVMEPPRDGKWIKADGFDYYRCSCCSTIWDSSIACNFRVLCCPTCGARMTGRIEDASENL